MQTTTTKSRPILFSGPMVRAILEGRKTQTRRVVKPQPERKDDAWFWKHPKYDNGAGVHYFHTQRISESLLEAMAQCNPYGQPGDSLWVRERWAVSCSYDSYKPSVLTPHVGTVQYSVAGENPTCFDIDGNLGRWRPSIHMPRWASRISLTVTDVRVERLQDISGGDAKAEGVTPIPFSNGTAVGIWEPGYGTPGQDSYTPAFRALWDQIQLALKDPGKGYAWSRNPWVWVIEFET